MRRAIQLSLCGGLLIVFALVIGLARRVHAVTTTARAVRWSEHVPEAMGIVWTTAFIGVALTATLVVTILWRKRP
ncbi:hypothetical protein HN371_21650 [Candidatus Poribacteria bacterium]|jgi:hypothetical protein|nr:hypothetical protein [Candidatus Poribacteria bacterium]MBT5531839.1 hypothetical protein [Candidatus Poribacteria bacterium]MBT5712702.1 hypothetical protein [Candidatus Poribacteria bacterium]MBT7806095.1 hypothetical protein [Candidatus Poribacteria bacterium]